MGITKSLKMLIVGFFFVGIIFSIPVSYGQGKTNNILFENDNFVIKITGNDNIPQYSFWKPGQNQSDKYQIKFIRLFEAIDANNDGFFSRKNESVVKNTNYGLSSLDWNFSNLITEGNQTDLNITTQGLDFEIQFRNHFDAGDTSLKFDISVKNYTFVSDDANAMLVFGFHLISRRQSMNQEQNRVEFGNNGYIESDDEAQAGNETVRVKMSNGEENNNRMAYIAFPRFEGDLFYDPTIGLGDGLTLPGYSISSLGLLSIIGILSIAMRNRINNYR